MNVNVKNPTKPYSAPPYIQEKTDKRVSWFLLEFYNNKKKNLKRFYGAQRIWLCRELQRGDGTSHFFTSGSEIITRSKQDFLEVEDKQDALMSAYRSQMCVWGLYLSAGLQDMHEIVSRAHKDDSLRGDWETVERVIPLRWSNQDVLVPVPLI